MKDERATSQRETSALRTVVVRLSTASSKQLPDVIPSLARILVNCKTIIQSGALQRKDATESSLYHKLRTRVNTFLNSKSAPERWAAVILIKTIVDIGEWPVLKECRSWMQGLRSMISKNIAPLTRKLCIITLTKMYLLTHAYPTLVREFTTPELQEYVKLCVTRMTPRESKASVDSSQNATTLCMLQSFERLLPFHPTIFRPFLSPLRGLLLHIIGTCSSDDQSVLVDCDLLDTAQRLSPLLHYAAPRSDKDGKKEGPEKMWSDEIAAVIADAHSTATQVFRSVHEEWQSSCGVAPGVKSFEGDVSSAGPTRLGLAGWTCIHDGSARLRRLLDLARHFTITQTVDPADYPLAQLIDLLTRIFLVVVPVSHKTSSNLKSIEGASAEEKDALWTESPGIHVSAIETAAGICDRFGYSALSVHSILLEHIEWVFRHENHDAALRASAYSAVTSLLQLLGTSIQRAQVRQLNSLMQICCSDIVPSHGDTKQSTDDQKSITTSLNADSFLGDQKTSQLKSATPSIVTKSARILLSTFLAKVPAQQIPSSLRATLDRTAVLSQDKDALLASCLNPPLHRAGEKPKPSLLPFLARLFPEALETEALVRPRMPVVTMNERVDEEESEISEDGEKAPVFDILAHRDDVDLALEKMNDASDLSITAAHSASVVHAEKDPLNSNQSVTEAHMSAMSDISRKRPLSPDNTIEAQIKKLQRESPATKSRQSHKRAEDAIRDAPDVEPVVMEDTDTKQAGETVMTMHVPDTQTGQALDSSDDDRDVDEDDFVIPPLYLNSDNEDEGSEEDEEDKEDVDDQPDGGHAEEERLDKE